MLDRLPSLVNPWSQGKAGCISISKVFCPPSIWGHITQQAGLHNGFIWTSAFHQVKGQGNIQGPTVRTERGRYREWDPASQPEQTLREARLGLPSHQVKSVQHEALGDHGAPHPTVCGDQLSCQGHPTRARVWPGRENTERGHSGVVLCKNS